MLKPGHTASETEMLEQIVEYAEAYLTSLEDGPVAPTTDDSHLRRRLDIPLQAGPLDASAVIRELVAGVEGGLTRMGSGRFFGFVIGGAVPASLGADWMTSAWDQNAGLHAPTPAASIVEEVTGGWLKDLLGLPAGASFALVTGAQMSNTTCLAAARNHVLAAAGWDVERRGLIGAPAVRVLAGARRHATIDRALRLLGLGLESIEAIDVDDQGRIRVDALEEHLGELSGPVIVCAQAGEINTGAFDDFTSVIDAAHRTGAWVHVDGAFGLWAAASPALRHLVAGVEAADSWTTDCHKWLNVPYDCGVAVCAHPDSHRSAMSVHADYLVQSEATGPRDAMDYTPEFSRRARAFPVYAALRSLGRDGVAAMIESNCTHARRFAEALSVAPGVRLLNEVVLNQVLLRFQHPTGGDDDAHTHAVVDRVQRSGVCYPTGTTWQGRPAMRISVCNWRTSASDVERSLAAILEAAARE